MGAYRAPQTLSRFPEEKRGERGRKGKTGEGIRTKGEERGRQEGPPIFLQSLRQCWQSEYTSPHLEMGAASDRVAGLPAEMACCDWAVACGGPWIQWILC